MSRPTDVDSLLRLIRTSGLVDGDRLDDRLAAAPLPPEPERALAALVECGLITAFHARFLREGKTRGLLLGPYRVLRPLGKGGMGLVYLAEQPALGRQVAIKVLRTEMHAVAGARERFAREARATAALDHPNIVRIFDVQQDGDVHYLVMEYVDGQPLSHLVEKYGRLPVYRAVEMLRQAAAGLEHAHERGVIHRDLKPANLLVDRSGTVKVLDMGLARFYEDTADNLTERLGGGVLGSPDYVAPEQASGTADRRSDIYSLGATFYCLLVGEPPFPRGTAAERVIAHETRPVSAPHVKLPTIPLEVSALILKMLAKSPDDRCQSAAEVIERLDAAYCDPPKPAAPPARRRDRRWTWAWAAAVAGGVGLGGLLRWWGGW